MCLAVGTTWGLLPMLPFSEANGAGGRGSEALCSLQNALRWNPMRGKTWRDAPMVRERRAQTPTLLKWAVAHSTFRISLRALCKVDETHKFNRRELAYVHLNRAFCYQLLVQSGTPLHRNVSAAGSWEKGVWSMELRSGWPRRSAKLFDYILLCFLMKLNYRKRTTALPWSYSE